MKAGVVERLGQYEGVHLDVPQRMPQVTAVGHVRHVIKASAVVGPQWVSGEVVGGQADIALVDIHGRIAPLGLEPLVGQRVRFPEELDHRLAIRKAGVVGIVDRVISRLVNGLKAIGFTEITLGDKAHAFAILIDPGVAKPGVQPHFIIGAKHRPHVERLAVRNGRGEEVNRTAGGMRSELDLAASLENFHRAHPPDRGKVIGRGSGVGCRRGQDTIFHDRHLGAASHVDSTQADIWKVAEAILFPQVNTWHLGQDPVGIVVRMAADRIQVEPGSGSGRRHRSLDTAKQAARATSLVKGRLDTCHDRLRQRHLVIVRRFLRQRPGAHEQAEDECPEDPPGTRRNP